MLITQTFKNKKYTVLTMATMMVVALMFSGCDSSLNQVPSNQVPVDQTQNTAEALLSPYEVVAQALNELNNLTLVNKFVSSPDQTLWWIADDGYNILIHNPTYISVNLPSSVDEKALEKNRFENDVANISDTIRLIMEKNGFQLDVRNSSRDRQDETFTDFVQAYKKDDTLCALTVSPDVGSVKVDEKDAFYQQLSFACSDVLQKFYDEQVPYLKGLDENSKNAVIGSIGKQSGDFVMVSVSGRRAGYYAILKKDGDGYAHIFSGQDQAPCSTMKTFKVPQELYGECYDEAL